ncbi:MAG: succinyl-diaminopimelate desuccinylase [Arenicellaceae bacterium]|nr:succinyl-diaminopimelate desuccinylase [Arenicellaceae bacterium]
MDDPTLALGKKLIECRSVTPDDGGCQELLAQRLEAIGFTCERLKFGKVDNLWARLGSSRPLIAFAGHTDVVPAGQLTDWVSDPFTPTIRDGVLYGRGAADMKSSIAAFITSIESFISQNQKYDPKQDGSIGVLITSDEEGPATDGTIKVVETLNNRDEIIDYCIVGEPSSTNVLGDTIKVGRRGSLGATLEVIGTQGHIAYPHLADNPIHQLGPLINALTSIRWDNGNEYFPPTTLQVSNITSGTGASNVIPGSAQIKFNLRYSTETSASQIETAVAQTLDSLNIDYQIDWVLSGLPFLTKKGALIEAITTAIKSELGIDTELSTSGGTSDGRFIAPYGTEVVELGPINASIHKVDECIVATEPAQLSALYTAILNNLLCQ